MENKVKTTADDSISVDPLLLFQRLLIVGADTTDDLFSYELCSYPPALFNSPGYMLSRRSPILFGNSSLICRKVLQVFHQL